MLNFSELINAPNWFSNEHKDIFLSGCLHLHRNLEGFYFPNKLNRVQAEQVNQYIKTALTQSKLDGDGEFLPLDSISKVEVAVLRERKILPIKIYRSKENVNFFYDHTRKFRIMTNAEDHLELLLCFNNCDLTDVTQKCCEYDLKLGEFLKYAFDEKLGHMTANPLIVGNGMQVTFLLHLPALSLTREMSRIIKGLTVLNLGIHGPHGEGSPMLGNLYNVSSQQTLGASEETAINNTLSIAMELVDHEKRARQMIVKHASEEINDKIWRAYGLLGSARKLSLQEGLHALSAVRLGQYINEADEEEFQKTANLTFAMFPGHIRQIVEFPLEEDELARERANIARKIINEVKLI